MPLLAILILCAVALALPAAASAAPLPRVDVDPAETIGDKDIPARMSLPGFEGTVAIELRGQSSRKVAKKSYGFELQDAEGKNLDASLLGMPADDDWILYAAYNDRTLMRNVLACETARRLGGYAARSRFVELVVNGRPDGVYVLMEKPKLQKSRVQGGDDAFLLELTSRRQAVRKDPSFLTPVTRRPIVWEDPERKDLTRAQARGSHAPSAQPSARSTGAAPATGASTCTLAARSTSCSSTSSSRTTTACTRARSSPVSRSAAAARADLGLRHVDGGPLRADARADGLDAPQPPVGRAALRRPRLRSRDDTALAPGAGRRAARVAAGAPRRVGG